MYFAKRMFYHAMFGSSLHQGVPWRFHALPRNPATSRSLLPLLPAIIACGCGSSVLAAHASGACVCGSPDSRSSLSFTLIPQCGSEAGFPQPVAWMMAVMSASDGAASAAAVPAVPRSPAVPAGQQVTAMVGKSGFDGATGGGQTVISCCLQTGRAQVQQVRKARGSLRVWRQRPIKLFDIDVSNAAGTLAGDQTIVQTVVEKDDYKKFDVQFGKCLEVGVREDSTRQFASAELQRSSVSKSGDKHSCVKQHVDCVREGWLEAVMCPNGLVVELFRSVPLDKYVLLKVERGVS